MKSPCDKNFSILGDALINDSKSAVIFCFFDDVADERSRCKLPFNCFNEDALLFGAIVVSGTLTVAVSTVDNDVDGTEDIELPYWPTPRT